MITVSVCAAIAGSRAEDLVVLDDGRIERGSATVSRHTTLLDDCLERHDPGQTVTATLSFDLD